jgi:capsular polysaccharide transport system permease protein
MISKGNFLGLLRKALHPLFATTVLAPTLLASVYFGLLASDVYVSESRVVIRTPEKPSGSALGVILKGTGFATNSDEIDVAQSAVLSRDALKFLNRKEAFRKAFSRSDISVFDRFAPLGINDSFEDLFIKFRKQVSVERESGGNIVVLRVMAFTPQDARYFNEQLLEIAEGTVNRLNERGRSDLIKFASEEVDEAQSKVQTAAVALAAFRQRTQIVDPDKQAAIKMQMIAKLQDELIATRSQIRGLQAVAPRNSQITVLQAKLRELRKDIRSETAAIAGAEKSLATASVEYQRLEVNNQVAAKQLTGALASLEEARNEARRKQGYVERIAEPSLPDASLQPRRLYSIMTVLALGLIFWGIVNLLLAGIKEHVD